MDELSAALETISRYPIRIDTAAKMLAERYELGVGCYRCQRWGVIDLTELVARGKGDRPLSSFRTRCSICGGPGRWQVRPPAPFVEGYPGHS